MGMLKWTDRAHAERVAAEYEAFPKQAPLRPGGCCFHNISKSRCTSLGYLLEVCVSEWFRCVHSRRKRHETKITTCRHTRTKPQFSSLSFHRRQEGVWRKVIRETVSSSFCYWSTHSYIAHFCKDNCIWFVKTADVANSCYFFSWFYCGCHDVNIAVDGIFSYAVFHWMNRLRGEVYSKLKLHTFINRPDF